MYAICLWCHHPLGRNEAIEHFPVGRRLAYDAAKGRLWVVCRRCQRWNLTPLEERWEAIDEAERAYRATGVRVATDNIGLARLGEGLELVRIGRPPRLELATWRYGDQFGRRRRKYIAWTTLGGTLGLVYFAGTVLGGASVLVLGAQGLYMGHMAADYWKTRQQSRKRTVLVPNGEGGRIAITPQDAASTELVRVREVDDWRVIVRQTQLPIPRYGVDFAKQTRTTLTGGDAERALATVLPYVNGLGGKQAEVREAVELLTGASAPRELLRTAAGMQNKRAVPNHLGWLPVPVRLALEMALHEDDERRAMEGELATLEARWREAEEIARIADALSVPETAEEKLKELKVRVSGEAAPI